MVLLSYFVLLAIIANSDLRRGIEFDCNKEPSLVHFAMISDSVRDTVSVVLN